MQKVSIVRTENNGPMNKQILELMSRHFMMLVTSKQGLSFASRGAKSLEEILRRTAEHDLYP